MKIETVKVVPHSANTNYRRQNLHGKIYFGIKDENLMDNLLNRRTRPYNEFRKMLPDVLKAAGLDIDPKNFRWSQKAGCGCGCSPGFVDKEYRMMRKDIYVDIVS